MQLHQSVIERFASDAEVIEYFRHYFTLALHHEIDKTISDKIVLLLLEIDGPVPVRRGGARVRVEIFPAGPDLQCAARGALLVLVSQHLRQSTRHPDIQRDRPDGHHGRAHSAASKLCRRDVLDPGDGPAEGRANHLRGGRRLRELQARAGNDVVSRREVSPRDFAIRRDQRGVLRDMHHRLPVSDQEREIQGEIRPLARVRRLLRRRIRHLRSVHRVHALRRVLLRPGERGAADPVARSHRRRRRLRRRSRIETTGLDKQAAEIAARRDAAGDSIHRRARHVRDDRPLSQPVHGTLLHLSSAEVDGVRRLRRSLSGELVLALYQVHGDLLALLDRRLDLRRGKFVNAIARRGFAFDVMYIFSLFHAIKANYATVAMNRVAAKYHRAELVMKKVKKLK
uniref:Uncharacterized protein n=1 Tax=Trichogramma kaykai TaxID=54128 RepID=A0ABD2XRH2_9HYME